mgnify:CR=1 FL=1
MFSGFSDHIKKPVNLIGKAGQGKSPKPLALFFDELKNGDRFPIFVVPV